MMTTISFNSVPSSDPYSIVGPNPAIDRIKTVIDSIKTYGVDSKYIFSVDDLHEAKHIPLVVRCLEEIEKMVQFLNYLVSRVVMTVYFTNKFEGYHLKIKLLIKIYNFKFPAKTL